MVKTGPPESQRFLDINRSCWNQIAGSTKGRTALPSYGPLCPDDDELQLLGDVTGKRVIELGCGDGKSLAYLHQRGAAELYGIDLAEEQIRVAQTLATHDGFPATFFCSSMEEDPGLPHNYFDLALSLYAIGWSVDLDITFAKIATYLAPAGVLIFSWEHPVFSCLKDNGQHISLSRSYSAVGPTHKLSWNGVPIVMHARKLSTFLNAVIASGLVIDKVIEGDLRPPVDGSDYPHRWYNQRRAQLMPTTFIVKAHKPR